MHKSRKLRLHRERNEIPDWKSDTTHMGKVPVMGIIDRETREVRCRVIPNVRREVLQAEILKHVADGSSVYTDDLKSYSYLPVDKFVHSVVDHEKEYVRGQVHTNGLENFWSLLKRGPHGTYVSVEPFHLDRYVDEQVFRFNNRKDGKRKVSDSERFTLAMSRIAGKRLTYSELTGKDVDTLHT
jgi:transposase-like protein